jgi:hypothetical protein
MSAHLSTIMSLVFSAAHSARDERSVQRALRVWRETGVAPVPHILAETSKTSELPIALTVPSVRGKKPLA